MKILDLVLKSKWYDMIASGEKREEYREIKPYWEKRLVDYNELREYYRKYREELAVKRLLFPNRPVIENICGAFPRGYTHIRFHRGYTNTTVLFKCEGITIGRGNPAWGAPDEEVFIIKLGEKSIKKQ